MATCKHCGGTFDWGQDPDTQRFLLMVPVGEEGNLDRSIVDENGQLRADHRDICRGAGGKLINATRLASRIPAAEAADEQTLRKRVAEAARVVRGRG